MDQSPATRPDFTELPSYRAGAKAPDAVSLASNEAPFGPTAAVAAAVAGAALDAHRYPDPGALGLLDRLATHLGVSVDHIALGTGSVAICQQVTTTMCRPGDEVVYAWRSFEAYPIVTRLAHAESVTVPLLADARHDLAAMAAAVTERTKVIFVCTPNNPTGPSVAHTDLEWFLQQVPKRVLVVIDEAYFEYAAVSTAPEGGRVDALGLAAQHSNVLVMRTFSKAYGLAGLRVGYAVGPPPLIADLRKSALPFGVNHLAQVGATAALDHQEELTERVTTTTVERDRVVARARDLGFTVPETQANFYWLPLGSQAVAFADRCRAAGVLVRAFPGEGVRVTVGEPAANDLVLEQLAHGAGGCDSLSVAGSDVLGPLRAVPPAQLLWVGGVRIPPAGG